MSTTPGSEPTDVGQPAGQSRTAPSRTTPSRTPPEPAAGSRDETLQPDPGYLCDLCGAPMDERHCKLLCLQCGYQRDCSDP